MKLNKTPFSHLKLLAAAGVLAGVGVSVAVSVAVSVGAAPAAPSTTAAEIVVPAPVPASLPADSRFVAGEVKQAVAPSKIIEPTAAAEAAARAAGAACVDGDPADPQVLSELFASTATGISGADYPHAYDLGDGRVLWMFQDVFFGSDNSLWNDQFAHNAALVQTGRCFQLIKPANSNVDLVNLPSGGEHLNRWLWPLDGEIGADGMLHVFFVEMINAHATGAAGGATPVSTWSVTINPATLDIMSVVPASDAGAQLYGWSIVTDGGWSYLFGNCYRQFTTDMLWFGQTEPQRESFDTSCTTKMFLARVPAGEFGVVPSYWDGGGWVSDPTAAAAVFSTGGISDQWQVAKLEDRFVAVSKKDDWWGSDLVVYESETITGGWVAVSSTPLPLGCDNCNTYAAEIVSAADGELLVVYSNNSWNMEPEAFNDATLYRLSFISVKVGG